MEARFRTGVYSLANDAVLDWTIALLESYRLHEADRPIIFIPFDDDITELSRLADRYAFEILRDETLEELDEIGASLWPENFPRNHLFRKFAAFSGPIEQFLFLDADVVVLDALDELFATFARSECDLIYSDAEIDAVYLPGRFRDAMRERYAVRAFNTGAFLSSRLALTLDDLRGFVPELFDHRHDLAPTGEQPVLNYCFDRKGLSAARFSEANVSIGFSCWAGEPGVTQARQNSSYCDGEGKGVPFLHWAGFALDSSMPYYDIFKRFRDEADRSILSD